MSKATADEEQVPNRKRVLKDLIAVPIGITVLLIGVQHFVRPEIFDAIVPAYLGWPRFWTFSSGALEILLGAGMCLSASRAIAARLFFYLLLLLSLRLRRRLSCRKQFAAWSAHFWFLLNSGRPRGK